MGILTPTTKVAATRCDTFGSYLRDIVTLGWRPLSWNSGECSSSNRVSSANKIGDKTFMQQQIRCILGPDSACDEIGLKAKRIGPLVLSNHCPRPMCDECTKKAVRMVVARMQNNYPKEWFRIQQRLTRG